MFKNYLRIAIRNLLKQKVYSFINIFGLAIGMCGSILILLWVLDELKYDRFHKDIDRIYQVMENQEYAKGNIFTVSATPGPLAPALNEEIPEIEFAATYTWNINYLFTLGEKSIKERGIYARPDLFRILSIELLSGNQEELLTTPNSVVISQDLARRFFGDENPVGKSILINQDQLHKITGVYRRLPDHSSLQFDFVLPFEDFLKTNQWATTWGSNGPRTLVKLKERSDKAIVDAKIKNFIKERNENSIVELFLYPYADLYLYGRFSNGKAVGGQIEHVRLFSMIALFVLLIACINFMNLSTARASRRTKEVGIRKCVGASRRALISQHIGESMVIVFLSLLISLLLVELFLPIFNHLTEKQVAVNYADPPLLLLFLGMALLTGVVAGSYPAFYLSAFQPVNVLKQNLKSSTGELFVRKGLVIFQFSLSAILIVATIIIYNQIQYVQNKNLGYKKENLIYFTIEGEMKNQWEAFRHEMLQHPKIIGISRSNHVFLGRSTNTSGVSWPGKPANTEVLFESILVDYDLIETFGFEIAEGRSFSREHGADSSRVIVNQAAVKVMELENPIGQIINFWEQDWEIIGVLKDFHYESLRYNVEPLFMILNTDYAQFGFVRLQSDEINKTIQGVGAIYKKFNPAYPFVYSFLDQQYAALYWNEMQTGTLSKYFSIFAIIISCLGLFGLSVFTAEQRTKEIGIRKVLGATVTGLILLLSKDLVKLVLIALVIAVPVSWWLLSDWLNNFAYRTEMAWWVFAMAGGLTLMIALMTVSIQAVKAALANPVDSLRYE
ncbi:MAG: ABC transporter permease [candidate division KSB1 bacterium]|nr:ABC transporter permease [candidate division KSB1 bacterium]